MQGIGQRSKAEGSFPQSLRPVPLDLRQKKLKIVMKKIYLFSIGQLIKLVELLKPIIEIVMQVINVFKKDKKEEEGGEEDDEESK